MHLNTKYAVKDDALQFLSQEWSYARLRPNVADTPGDHKAISSNADDKAVTKSEAPIKNTTVPATPAREAKPVCSQLDTTTTTDSSLLPIPKLILPSQSEPYDSKEFYKTGCIMAMLLNEQQPAAPGTPPRELIVTTKNPWNLADEEKKCTEKAAHRAWVKSGAAACAGLAASRWYNAASEKKPVAHKAIRIGRVNHRSCNPPAACAGLAASRWYTV